MLKKVFAIFTAALVTVAAIPAVSSAASTGTGGEPKLIAFTFDDGPSANTSALLDGLRSRGAQATFFMTAKNGTHGILNHQDLLKRMVAEGHQTANHTYDHPAIANLSAAEVKSEFGRVESLISKAQGGNFQLMARTPGGAVNSTIKASAGAPIILWSLDTLDWKYRNADRVYSNIVSGARDGSIVLLHDLYPTSIQGALRAMDTLKARGYEFVTVAELMRRRSVTPSNGSTYSSVPKRGSDLPAYSQPVAEAVCDESGLTLSLSFTENGAGNAGLKFYYTTDGSEPTLASSQVSGVLVLDEICPDGSFGQVIKVRGIDRYGTRTPVTTCTADRYGHIYTDVADDDWFAGTVSEAAAAGLMTGTGTCSFSPNGSLTRGMAVTVLKRFDEKYMGQQEAGAMALTENEVADADENAPTGVDSTENEVADASENAKGSETPSFVDVSAGAWYAEAASWAAALGICEGTGDMRFEPDAQVTRDQLAVMIGRYLVVKELADMDAFAASHPLDQGAAAFADWGDVPDWAQVAMLWCADAGIITGTDDGRLVPAGCATRAQCAAVLLRLRDWTATAIV